jgi:hypothetical protein
VTRPSPLLDWEALGHRLGWLRPYDVVIAACVGVALLLAPLIHGWYAASSMALVFVGAFGLGERRAAVRAADRTEETA